MPLKLNVGASRKVTDNNYGSRGASVNVEMELDNSLVSEPAKLQDRIRQLFGVVRSSLAEEINGGAAGPSNPGGKTGTGSTGNGNGNGQKNNPRPATQSQIKAIHAIARSQRIDVFQILRDRFHVSKPDDLSIKEASQLIDSLKSQREGG